MDAEIQQIYDLLVDTNYPVTLAELKNPTSECMVKVVLTFLSGNSIDGKTIQRVRNLIINNLKIIVFNLFMI